MFLCFSNFGIYTLMSKLWLYFLFNFAKKICYFSKNWDFIVSDLMFSFLTWINILPFKNWSSILSKLVLHSLFIFRSFISKFEILFLLKVGILFPLKIKFCLLQNKSPMLFETDILYFKVFPELNWGSIFQTVFFY